MRVDAVSEICIADDENNNGDVVAGRGGKLLFRLV